MRMLLTSFLLLGLPGGARVAPVPKIDLTVEEQAVLELTNQERAKEKLPPLKPNPILMKIARAHSQNMAKQEKLAHELDGKKPHQRAEDAGYKLGWIGENCAVGSDPYAPKDVVKSWMDSPGHRRNILDKRYTEIGIGMAKTSGGDIYWTQVFGNPPER